MRDLGMGGVEPKCGAAVWIDAGKGVPGECRIDEGIVT